MTQSNKIESTLTLLQYFHRTNATIITTITTMTAKTGGTTVAAEILGGHLGPFEYYSYLPLTPP